VGSERERARHRGRASRQLPARQARESGDTIDWLWPAAERTGLPIALMAANFLPKVAEVAQRHPNLKLILDHLGRPSGVTGPRDRWANLQEVLALAKYPNVAMKATGAELLRPAVPVSWRQCVTLFTEELPWLRGRDLELAPCAIGVLPGRRVRAFHGGTKGSTPTEFFET
jgi:predicted TIM-barrel fold metal-dependent hydrolase